MFALRVKNLQRLPEIARCFKEWDLLKEERKDILICKRGVTSKIVRQVLNSMKVDEHDYEYTRRP